MGSGWLWAYRGLEGGEECIKIFQAVWINGAGIQALKDVDISAEWRASLLQCINANKPRRIWGCYHRNIMSSLYLVKLVNWNELRGVWEQSKRMIGFDKQNWNTVLNISLIYSFIYLLKSFFLSSV